MGNASCIVWFKNPKECVWYYCEKILPVSAYFEEKTKKHKGLNQPFPCGTTTQGLTYHCFEHSWVIQISCF